MSLSLKLFLIIVEKVRSRGKEAKRCRYVRNKNRKSPDYTQADLGSGGGENISKTLCCKMIKKRLRSCFAGQKA